MTFKTNVFLAGAVTLAAALSLPAIAEAAGPRIADFKLANGKMKTHSENKQLILKMGVTI